MADYYNRQSARACEGDPVRIIRTYRLHPDRIDDLDRIARAWCVTKSRAIETMIQSEASLLGYSTSEEAFAKGAQHD